MQLSKPIVDRLHIRLWQEYQGTRLDSMQLFFILTEYFEDISVAELPIFIDNLVKFNVLIPRGREWIVEPPINLM
jgi:hypothetical protein